MKSFLDSREIPVLFLSARDQDEDRLLGLGLGADDYLTKPFLPKELILRLRAILRRTYGSEESRPQSVLSEGGRLIWPPGSSAFRMGAAFPWLIRNFSF